VGDFVRRVNENGVPYWYRDRCWTGPYEPSWRFEARRGQPVRALLTIEFDEMPGWEVRFEYELRDRAIQCVRQHAERVSDDAGPSVLYRKFGGRELEQQVAAEFRQDIIRMAMPPEWRAAALETRRTGRQPVTDLELCELAEAYVNAWESDKRRPMVALRERDGRSMNTLQGLKKKAVERGFLILNGQGKPGGYLTPKAEQLLSDSRRK
jgi:hypothetical protein